VLAPRGSLRAGAECGTSVYEVICFCFKRVCSSHAQLMLGMMPSLFSLAALACSARKMQNCSLAPAPCPSSAARAIR